MFVPRLSSACVDEPENNEIQKNESQVANDDGGKA